MELKKMIIRAARKTKSYLRGHSPTILCGVAAIGVISTGITASIATLKAKKRIDEEPYGKELSKGEIFIAVAPYYIPATAIATGTIICIFGANTLNKRQQATLLSAYSLVDTQFREYKNKVKEIYGEEAHNDIVDAIIKEKCEDIHIFTQGMVSSSTLDPDTDVNEVVRTFYDFYSERYFESTMSKVIQAEYHLNRNFVIAGSASVNNFYEFLGLSKIPSGDITGWAIMDEQYWIDFNHRTITLNDGLEVIGIEMMEFTPPEEYLYSEFAIGQILKGNS